MRAPACLILMSLAAFSFACGSSPVPTSPTPPPAAATWTVSGTVTSSAGGVINAASIAILDGPDAGRTATADTAGRYSLAGVREAGFTLRASANGYTPVSKGVTLTGNVVSDFQLPRVPVAALTFEGDLGFDTRPDGGFDVHATGVNTGDGCAGSIAGTTTITGAITLSFPWTLPATLIVRPGERFQYLFGPISRGDVAALAAGASYVTRFTFVTVACP